MSVSVDSTAGVPQVLAGRLHDPSYRGFASDNYAGAHPEIIEAVQAANEGHVTAYGEDVYTGALQQVIQKAPPDPDTGWQTHPGIDRRRSLGMGGTSIGPNRWSY